ncbi:AMP-binding protein [Skermania sp. ID1734]|uniref:AMP-binding protein n=1 Tax=Skermania sp. ID1734 TaxID=2597516 RepID=UPI0011809143|nr:AMP-binding protein [Skermania sp. ID1734]TSD94240.1 AMP-binding protein [Skermania sp. ID1734]
MKLSASAHIDTFCRDNLPPYDQWPVLRYDLAELDYPERVNCAAELLDHTIGRLGPDRPCVAAEDMQWSYGELLRHANQVANVLVNELHIVPGNRVLLRGPNTPWLVAAWFGVVKAGAVAVTTVPALRTTELADIVELSRPSAALCDHRALDDLRAVQASIPIVAYGGDAADDLVNRCPAQPDVFTNIDTAADDVVLLAFTSGTTGKPKAAMHFHRDVLAIADTFSRHILKPTPEDVFIGTPPMAFTFGLGGLVIFPMRIGASSYLIERATPTELADVVQRIRATVLFTAPTAYRAIIATGDVAKLRSVRRAVSAGEHLPESVWRQFHIATGLSIINGIGATEMLHVFIASAGDDIRPGATGKVVPGYEAMVLDEFGEPVPDGKSGRLAVRGPTGCRYLADDRQRVYVENGWNITGDTFRRDADGYFWYEARNDDMIISAGYNIAAPEVEQALLLHPDVAECAVVGWPDENRGSIVKAYVVLAPDATGDEDEIHALQDHVKAAIAPYKYPRAIEFLPALPKTATGKVSRKALRDLATVA